MRVTRRRLLAGSLLASIYGLAAPLRTAAAPGRAAAAATGTTVPWRNWSGGLMALPRARFSPTTESELARFLAASNGPLRPVGSGHSFSPLVPTDGTLIVLDRVAGLLGHDAAALRATFAAGTRLADTGPALDAVGQAFFNLPDIDRQTLAGATATATHGTGIGLRCLSAYVTALRLVTPGGAILELDSAREPKVFAAARVGLGALGIVTQVTLQNRTPYPAEAARLGREDRSIARRVRCTRRRAPALRDIPAHALRLLARTRDRRDRRAGRQPGANTRRIRRVRCADAELARGAAA
jgi:FAD/FMN-containing dehydrogenase